MTTSRSRHALVMAFDEPFAIGGELALASFLRQNSWFSARVIVFGDRLSVASRESLLRHYPVEFIDPDPALTSICERLARGPMLGKGSSLRLSSLGMFRLLELDRALFLDADVICLGDVRSLFDSSCDFSAAPDLVQLRRELDQDRADVAPSDAAAGFHPYGKALDYSFNSGVMAVSGRWLTPDTYRHLLELPGFDNFSGGAARLADQYLLNRHFDGQVTPLDPRYNFVVSSEALVRRLYGLTLGDVRLLHFAGYLKPWQMTWRQARERVPPRFLRYYECWYELREQLGGELTTELALEQHRQGLDELSMASRR